MNAAQRRKALRAGYRMLAREYQTTVDDPWPPWLGWTEAKVRAWAAQRERRRRERADLAFLLVDYEPREGLSGRQLRRLYSIHPWRRPVAGDDGIPF